MTDITRRQAMTLAATAAAATTIPLTADFASAAAPVATAQAPGFYRYTVGGLQITAINDGFFKRPLDGFIRNVPLPDVQKHLEANFLPTDGVNIPFTTIVVNDGKSLTLIDTGNGNSGAPTSGLWQANFRAAGFTPEQVDNIVISHFHGDHINGIRTKEGAEVFPNAKLFVPKAEWDFWMDDARAAQAPDAMKPAFANVRRVFSPIVAKVSHYEGGKEVVTGVNAVASPGHTPGHTTFVIGGKLLALSDTSNHPALFVQNPGWHAIFDMDAAAAEATRRRLLDMAIADKLQVAMYHAPFPATGHIVKEATGYRLLPAQWSPSL
jgi:glyoxylase-like metal-dependent hydrolase (beta-lactamase superfamily II)